MPLLTLPNELLLEVAGYLEHNDLYHLILSNRRLASLLYIMLYQLAINSSRGNLALYSAAVNENYELVSLLLKNGVETTRLRFGWHCETVFHRLACSNNVAALKLLLEHGADTEERDGRGRTTLQVMAQYGGWWCLDALKMLLEQGAKTNSHDPISGGTSLHTAVTMGQPLIVELLLRGGAHANSRNMKEQTPLHLAGRSKFSKFGNRNFDYKENATSWDFPARKITPFKGNITPHEVIVRLLLENGADMNALDMYGRAPLHVAAREDERIATLLIDNGANIHIKDAAGFTPYPANIDTFLTVSLYRQASLVKNYYRRRLSSQFETITRRISTSKQVRSKARAL